jgi:hypothetical protein
MNLFSIIQTQNLRKFKVFECIKQVMIVATDKLQKEFHIIKIDKKNDNEIGIDFQLDEIINEEHESFTKDEYD